jgi:Ser/Thr protein kinase RdoA (MazF antagonist)
MTSPLGPNTDVTSALDTTPRFSGAEAQAVLRERFALDGVLTSLPSERDQNFRVDTPAGAKLVLKIAKADEERSVLDLQNAMIAHLRADLPDVDLPGLSPAVDGAAISEVRSGGRVYLVRLFCWVEGIPLAKALPHTTHLLATLGRLLGRIDRSLQGFSHPAIHRTLHWDLKHADQAFEYAALLTPEQRALIDAPMREWRRIPWSDLRHGAVHGDANDYNVLVRGGEVVTLLDFGDTVHSAVVCDLAIGLAYAMLDKPDPLSAACAVVAAYHRVLPLTGAEADAVFPLAVARLCMSVCLAAKNARDKGGDDYQQVSASPAWKFLARLGTIAPDRTRAALKDACA